MFQPTSCACTNAIGPKIFTKPHCNDVVGHNATISYIYSRDR